MRLMTSNNKTPTTGLTIGLDLGDRRHAVCVLNTRGHIIAEETLPNTRASLEQLSQRYPGATLAMETGTHSPWVSRLFEAHGHTVDVANAPKVRAISRLVGRAKEDGVLSSRNFSASSERKTAGACSRKNYPPRWQDGGVASLWCLNQRFISPLYPPQMGRPTGFEPATPRITILCSNQLSYGRRKGAGNFSVARGAVNPFFAANFALLSGCAGGSFAAF